MTFTEEGKTLCLQLSSTSSPCNQRPEEIEPLVVENDTTSKLLLATLGGARSQGDRLTKVAMIHTRRVAYVGGAFASNSVARTGAQTASPRRHPKPIVADRRHTLHVTRASADTSAHAITIATASE
jgi:hypothetical protein